MKYLNEEDFISNYIETKDTSKVSTKRLFKIVETRWSEQLWNIFDPKDDCFCAKLARERYKKKFIEFYKNK